MTTVQARPASAEYAVVPPLEQPSHDGDDMRQSASLHDHSPSRLELFRLFLSERRNPEPFYRRLADKSIAEFPFEITEAHVLDLGCGPGYYTGALTERGAQVIPTDLSENDLRDRPSLLPCALVSDATRLPFGDRTFDGVFCSNLLEHTPDPAGILVEIERVLRPGAWAYVSWTNWYSPWGGHAIAPFHYLGPRLGLKAYRAVLGEPKGKNLPYERLWPTHVGQVLRLVRARPGLRLIDALPRYYPSQRWILRVPCLREIAAWNCVLLIERRTDTS
jgi:SAM-dependent methyltransferase